MTNDEERTPDEQEQEVTEAEDIDRRRFLNLGWKVLGAGLIVEAGWTTYDILNPQPAKGFGGIVEAGPVTDFEKDGSVQYFLDGRFYVTSYQGDLRALFQKCPHLGCRVPFCETSERFECPCHGSLYNVLGEYIQGPAPRGLDRFPIAIKGDRVFVDTSNLVEGPPRGVLTGPSQAAGPSCLGGAGASGTGGMGPGMGSSMQPGQGAGASMGPGGGMSGMGGTGGMGSSSEPSPGGTP